MVLTSEATFIIFTSSHVQTLIDAISYLRLHSRVTGARLVEGVLEAISALVEETTVTGGRSFGASEVESLCETDDPTCVALESLLELFEGLRSHHFTCDNTVNILLLIPLW